MLFVFVVLMSPLVYDQWNSDEAAGSVATFVIWCALAVGGSLLMSGVRAQRLIHAAEEAEARHEARMDSLTGLHNRRAFDEILEREVTRARLLDVPLTMAMVDIVNFKEVNDRWSYAEGDRCLQEVGSALMRSVRGPDVCFPLGRSRVRPDPRGDARRGHRCDRGAPQDGGGEDLPPPRRFARSDPLRRRGAAGGQLARGVD